MKNKVAIAGAMCVFLLMAVFYGWRLHSTMYEYRIGETQYAELTQHITLPSSASEDVLSGTEPADGQEKTAPSQIDLMEEKELPPLPEVDFEALQQISPDIIAWLYIPETSISYPVVQGKDNRFYLKHLPDGTSNSSGSIFLDCTNSPAFGDRNSILYGHKMKNGTMFAELENYQEQSFFDEHPNLYLILPEQTYEASVFAALMIENTQDEMWRLDFTTKEDFSSWVDVVTERANMVGNTLPSSDDRILTLSTCSYHTRDGRFLLYATLCEIVRPKYSFGQLK